jgi:hypothetical protein
MFALCGVMIVVGVAYILVAPSKGSSESAAPVRPPTTRLAAASAPAATAPDASSTGVNARSAALDAQANEAGVGSVVTITTTTAPPAPPTTVARVTIPPTTTTTVVDPLAVAATATEALVRTVDTVLQVTLSAAVPTTVAPAPAVVKVSAHSDAGVASWFNAPDRTCAHRTLPFGTMVTVTRPATGAVTTCKVDDRGPTVETGRLIDLSMDTFAALASTSSGLIDVMIEW